MKNDTRRFTDASPWRHGSDPSDLTAIEGAPPAEGGPVPIELDEDDSHWVPTHVLDARTPNEGTFIYWRCARDEGNGLSEKRQIEACEDYVSRNHPSDTIVFGDRGRGGLRVKDRPGLESLLAAARSRRPRRIVVESVDRLSRSLPDLLRLYVEIGGFGIELHEVAAGGVVDLRQIAIGSTEQGGR